MSTEIYNIFIFFTGLKMELRGPVKQSYSLSVKWTVGRKKCRFTPSPMNLLVQLLCTASKLDWFLCALFERAVK